MLPFLFILPPITLSPTFFVTGKLSPVNIDSSTDVVPSVIIPSTAIFSPGFTATIFPTLRFSIITSFSAPFSMIFAFFGCNPISFFIADEVCPFVLASNNFPNEIKVIMIPADS